MSASMIGVIFQQAEIVLLRMVDSSTAHFALPKNVMDKIWSRFFVSRPLRLGAGEISMRYQKQCGPSSSALTD